MKKWKFILPAMVFIFIAVAVIGTHTALAASPEGDFIFDSGTGTITGYIGAGGAIEIPSSIGGVTVYAIGNDAFAYNMGITGVTIPSGVTSIGNNAFYDCEGLEQVTLDDGLESIGEGAFSSCFLLSAITIPDSVTGIAAHTFSGCSGLTNINIPDSVTAIGEYAFMNCSNFSSIILPEGLTSLGGHAFYACNLERITIPSSVTAIGEYAFYHNDLLTDITFPAGVNTIGTRVFWYCYSLKRAIFLGNPPAAFGGQVFRSVNKNFTVGYLYDNAGFTSAVADGSWNGYPAVPMYTVTYDGNGSDVGDVPADGKPYEQGEEVVVPGNTGSLVKTGCTFAGWNTAADGSGGSYNESDTFAMAGIGHVTLYAQWTENVPGAPTNVTAAAGDGEAAVSFTEPADIGGNPITGYTVTSSPGSITASGTGTAITVTGLSNGTSYTFTVAAANSAGTGPASAASNAVTPYRSSSGSSDGSSRHSTPASSAQGIDILINGQTETAATAATTQEGGQTVTTIVLDDKKLEERLQEEGGSAVVTIPFSNGADVVRGTLNGQTVKNMENKEAVLEMKTGQVTYTLPASQINIDAVSEQMGKQVELKDIAVSVKISEPAENTVKIIEDTADRNNYQIIVKPVEFEITCSSGDKTVEVSRFNVYVERMIAIPEDIDPSRITTGIILNPDGTFSHVPTVVTIVDGKYYARISSLTNSSYLIISSPKTFKDVEDHWAKEAVNDMASRLVVNGAGEDKFEPDRDITRADFVVIVVRALGLMRPGTGEDVFSDVVKGSYYYDAIFTARENGIISGCGNGKFGPNDRITREQAMTMIARAMKITGLEVEIVSGRSETEIAPKDNITRAEAAAIVRKLLQKSGLI